MTTEKAAAELRAWVAEEARRAREFDAGEHLREAFPQTATGRALAAAPLARSGRGPLAPGPLIVQREPTEGVTLGSGWQATLTADTTIPDGGGDVSFGTVETSHGVTVTAPTTEIVVPQDCVAAVQHLYVEWTDVDNDAAWKGHSAWAEVRVNGNAVAPRFEAGADGLSYSRLGPLPGPKMTLKQGDVVTVHVFQNSGSGQALTGRLSLGMEDPTVARPTLIEVAPGWELTFDGTNWWITDGDGSATVRQRDANWTQVSSFESGQTTAGISRVRGISWDGTHVWVCGLTRTIERYTTGGTLATSFQISRGNTSDNQGSNRGLAWDGTHVWVVTRLGSGQEYIDRYTTAGSRVGGGEVTTFWPEGLTFYQGSLWVTDSIANNLLELDPSDLSVIRTVSLDDVPFAPHGVYIAAGGVVYIGSVDDVIWRRTETV